MQNPAARLVSRHNGCRIWGAATNKQHEISICSLWCHESLNTEGQQPKSCNHPTHRKTCRFTKPTLLWRFDDCLTSDKGTFHEAATLVFVSHFGLQLPTGHACLGKSPHHARPWGNVTNVSTDCCNIFVSFCVCSKLELLM